MHTTRTITAPEITRLLTSTAAVTFQARNREETYAWVEQTLRETGYRTADRETKGIIRKYLLKMTGYGRSRIAELIRDFRQTAQVRVHPYRRHRFSRRFTDHDVALLAQVDQAHRVLSGPATRRILEREYLVYGKPAFARLASISVSHLYNLRQLRRYRETVRVFTKTRPSQIPIGERRKPEPNGEPGYLRVDSVHQGDSHEGTKGVYHVNLVDEVLQWELVVCVEGISERFLVPALEAVLDQFPFLLRGFHADNGSEFINRQVAAMLERLLVRLTKSRPRHSNDNGLVETKNGSVIRKHLGYGHIPQRYAAPINQWYHYWFNVYLNFHRPCAFGTEIVLQEKIGKRKRVYRQEDYQTPYEKLKSLPNPEQYLRPGVTFEHLDEIAYAHSDTEFAERMQATKHQLVSSIHSAHS